MAWVLALALTAAAVALALFARRRSRSAGPVSATSRTARGAEVARLATRVSAGTATNRARRVFASAERREQLDQELALKTAEEVTRALGQMKGALMKLGQLASFIDDGMPEPVRQALAQLQQDAPPMSAELAALVVERELGTAPDLVFERWDPIPIAAASIGQVHRAITRDGVAVAVKVQYPGVDEAIRSDLENMDMASVMTPFLYRGLEMEPLMEELKSRLVEELDYELEAANQTLFADWYRGHPFIHVPDVVAQLSTKRVLRASCARVSDSP